MSSNGNLFFSGFSFEGESELFKEYIDDSAFAISGFSHGAIEVFEYALKSKKRVDIVQLFSPAFFQTKSASYKRAQLLYYKKNRNRYIEEFLKNVSSPSSASLEKFLGESCEESLIKLLEYEWKREKVEKLLQNGTKLEIHLGKLDKIIDAKSALDFFRPFATIYFYNDFGHLLKGKDR